MNWDWPHYQTLFTNSTFTLSIVPAVHVKWSTTTNRAYQLLTAAAVGGPYLPAGGLIEGTGGEVGSFSEAGATNRFFRVEETMASRLSWLHGTWVGTACQTGEGVPLLDFTTRLDANATNRVFTITYSGPFDCTSVLSLLSYTDTQAFFYESVTSGNCFDETDLFAVLNQTNIAFHFFSTNPLGTGGGVLVKQ